MTGNTIGEFMDDLLLMGGPEKEFLFRNKFFFLETTHSKESGLLELRLDEYENYRQDDERFLRTYCFRGKTFAECVSAFEGEAIFDGMNVYQAEQEIEVLFG